MLRHERMSVGMALAESQHHTSRGQGRAEGLSTRQDSNLTGKPGAGQGSPLRVAPGVCRCSATSPMMGDAPSGVVARIWSRLLRESDPRTRAPQSPV